MLNRTYRQIGYITMGVASILTLSLGDITAVVHAQTNSSSSSDSLSDVVPDRRKGGASRSSPSPTTAPADMLEAPERRKPAASRPLTNRCDFNPQEVIALIPRNLQGMTASNSPSLFFSVPSISSLTPIEIIVRGPKDELIYKKEFKGKGQAGIMSLQLPPLTKVEGQYHWYLSVICNQTDRAYDVVVEGLLQPIQINSTIAQQLEAATPAEKVKLYQSQNLWHETLTTLATLKISQPQDATTLSLWSDVLKSVDLDPAIAQQPLLPH
ncbi:DUF928 domain-containing protein [Aphanothece sacrum]|uniref:DUF928 domain-containing protein n=1 Tax=Aphanothece sacrum FPU1 TaxID=1920663 RepID=A0A401IK85_APHSA|nr:DUF928 domain-containing protein [Aphanothece sacrum]GBF81725.1 hypothetical protein AsFPU1_3145 [Aphanothece sacrum FPU1]GBF85083.1 hypothetical protein AsFPU3_2140 [Aphanothece sacrum FPU3]